jgi:hypothetical protein
MKKQWILIGTLAAIVAIAVTTVGLNRSTGDTVQGALALQGPTLEQNGRDNIAQEFAVVADQGPTFEQMERERDKYAQAFVAMVDQGPTFEQMERERDKFAQEFATMSVQE